MYFDITVTTTTFNDIFPGQPGYASTTKVNNSGFYWSKRYGWQWHQLDNVQIICTSLQTDNHAGTSPLSFTGQMPFLPPNQQRQSTNIKPLLFIFKSYYLGRLLRVDLITLEGRLKCLSVSTSVHKKFFRFQWNLVRRRAMHDGMPYDPNQGQGHGASEVMKIALF